MGKNSRSLEARKLAGYAFVAGMVLAPFLAAIYGWNVALAVMTFALAATTYLVWDARRTAPPELRPRLRLLAAANAVLMLLCGLLLAIRLI